MASSWMAPFKTRLLLLLELLEAAELARGEVQLLEADEAVDELEPEGDFALHKPDFELSLTAMILRLE